jgi:hypothetical protein
MQVEGNVIEPNKTCEALAYMKVGEEIFLDDPSDRLVVDGHDFGTGSGRHNLTAYVCEFHARKIFGDVGMDLVEKMRTKS